MPVGALYTGSIELRRLVVKFSRAPLGGGSEDYDAITCHFVKLTGGAPDSNWLAADYAAVEARFNTWWTAQKVEYPSWFKLASYVWYKDGPAWSPIDRGNGPSNPAARTTTVNSPGTATATAWHPPQLAVSVTKVCDIRKRWGRLYLYAGLSAYADSAGYFNSGAAASYLSRLVTCFNGCRADGKQPVVWSRARSSHSSKRGGTIDAHDATAYEITGLQIDNLYDVIRSRRYGTPTLRTLTNLT